MSRPPGRSRIERRTFLKLSGAAGASVALGGGSLALLRTRRAEGQSIAGGLTKFVDALPTPSTISPVGILNGDPFYRVTMRPFTQKLHRDLPPTPLWGYNAQYPGPTFEARRGDPIAVEWRNALPSTHMFPIDHTLHGAEANQPNVRTVVHLHGHKVLPDSDGYPTRPAPRPCPTIASTSACRS